VEFVHLVNIKGNFEGSNPEASCLFKKASSIESMGGGFQTASLLLEKENTSKEKKENASTHSDLSNKSNES